MNFRVAFVSRLLTSGGNLSLPYRMSSTNDSFERLEISLKIFGDHTSGLPENEEKVPLKKNFPK